MIHLLTSSARAAFVFSSFSRMGVHHRQSKRVSIVTNLQLTMGVVACLLGLPSIAQEKLASASSFSDTIEQRVKACVACHGAQGRSSSEGYFPRIAGKPAGYLLNQLINFRDRKRTYPQMNYIVAHLSDAYLKEMADYFALQDPPYAAPTPMAMKPKVVELGKTLVYQGDRQRELPACVSCHGERMTGIAPFVPGLLGLPRDYIVGQLGAWQTGNRRAHAPDCMAQIAKKLRAEDIEAISSWLSVQTIPQQHQAETVATGSGIKAFKWPLSCGSVQP